MLAFLEYMNHLLVQLYLFAFLLAVGFMAILGGTVLVLTIVGDFRNPPTEE